MKEGLSLRTAGLHVSISSNVYPHGDATHDYTNLELRHHHAVADTIFFIFCYFGCKSNSFSVNLQIFRPLFLRNLIYIPVLTPL